MITLDGSMLEGGGQILRTALALSGLTQEPFRITRIRHSRPSPGLKAQHLTAVKVAAEWCSASVEGARIGSEDLSFAPHGLDVRTLTLDIGTAGSITLLLQAILPLAMFSDRKVNLFLKGGTDVAWSPPFDYFTQVLLPHLKPFADVESRLLRRGYYPKGKGEVEITVKPRLSRHSCADTASFITALGKSVQPFSVVARGDLLQIKGVSHASRSLQKVQVAERQASAAKFYLSDRGCPVSVACEYHETASAGSGITLWAVFRDERQGTLSLGASALGERGLPSEKVGSGAALSLKEEISSGSLVDTHLADQLVLFMGLLPGSELKVREASGHCRTNCRVVERFLPVRFSLKKNSLGCAAAQPRRASLKSVSSMTSS